MKTLHTLSILFFLTTASISFAAETVESMPVHRDAIANAAFVNDHCQIDLQINHPEDILELRVERSESFDGEYMAVTNLNASALTNTLQILDSTVSADQSAYYKFIITTGSGVEKIFYAVMQ